MATYRLRHSVHLSTSLVLALALVWTGDVKAQESNQRWGNIVEAAKTEGKLVIHGSDRFALLFAEFEKRYPKIEVTLVGGGGSQITQRLMAERRAGKYLADLTICGSSTCYGLYRAKAIDPLRPALLLPEVLDQSKWWEGKLHFIDFDREYLLRFNGAPGGFVGYNNNLVSPKDFKSYWDIVTPKWRGKIVALDPMRAGVSSSLRFMFYHPELGPKFLRRLFGDMDLTFSRNRRQVVDWLAVGKFAISLLVAQRWLADAKGQGLPVDWFGLTRFKEGAALRTGTGNIVVMNRGPHPNAARVALNWFLSRDGQIAYQKVIPRANSLRIDIPKDRVAPDARRVGGVKYMITDRPEWLDLKPIRAFIKGVLASR